MARPKKKTTKNKKDDKKPEKPPAPPNPLKGLSLQEILLLRLVSPLSSLPVQTLEGVAYIRPENIAYITTSPKKDDRQLLIYDLDGNEWTRFGDLDKLLASFKGDPRFADAHRSFIVNAFAVKGIRTPKKGGMKAYFGDKVKGEASISDEKYKRMKPLLEMEVIKSTVK